jgi:3-phenylpropionate/trans-cinnamate dioxygenase ferredoxin reductase subunit
MIAIVGGGAAGWSAAEALRELGYDGELRLFGAEAAAPYERPALSKQFLADPAFEHPPALDVRPAPEPEVALELDTAVVAIDPRERTIRTSAGRILHYERLLLATGAACRRLRIPGSELAGIHYLRDVDDARALREELGPGRRIAIVGGGVIGLEVAASALARGCEVTVVEAGPQVMGRIAPLELATAIERLHRARGVAIRTSTRPLGLEAAGSRVGGVALDDGEVVPADAVIVGIGVEPRTELAVGAGLAVGDGVLVDERFRSSDERIFAAGDVACVLHAQQRRHVRSEQWRVAQEQGRRAAAAMLGAGEPYRDAPWMWSDQHDAHIQMSGFGFDGAQLVCRGDLAAREGIAYLGLRDGRLVAVCGMSLGTGIARTVRSAGMLIEQETPVDVEALRDPGRDFRRLARELLERRGGA